MATRHRDGQSLNGTEEGAEIAFSACAAQYGSRGKSTGGCGYAPLPCDLNRDRKSPSPCAQSAGKAPAMMEAGDPRAFAAGDPTAIDLAPGQPA